MTEEEKGKHLKIVLTPAEKEQIRRILWNHGDMQFFFSSCASALICGEEERTIGDILRETRRR